MNASRRHESDVSLATFFGLSEEAKIHVRNELVARAYSQLPGLNEAERALAKDHMLAAECSLWRVRFREMERDRDHEKQRADNLDEHVTRLTERVEGLLAGLATQPPESPGAEIATG